MPGRKTAKLTGKMTSREKGKSEAWDTAFADSKPDRSEEANSRPRLAAYETAKPEGRETANLSPKPEGKPRLKLEGNEGGSPLCAPSEPPPSRVICRNTVR